MWIAIDFVLILLPIGFVKPISQTFNQALQLKSESINTTSVWELQQDIAQLMTWAAGHGDTEALEWVNSNDPSKFTPYALYDIPGNAWGIGAMTNTTPYVYKAYDDYWDRVKSNVKAVYEKGLLPDAQWALWNERYENRDYYLGTKFTADPEVQKTWNLYKDRNAVDGKAMKEQVIDFHLPGEPYFEDQK